MFKHARKTIALAIAAVTLVGAGTASAASFGADVEPDVQPSNASTAHPCDYMAPGTKCTWVLNDAYGNAGGEKAPRSGELRSIKLIAGEAGSFKLQLVKVTNNQKAKVVTQGPRIRYDGQTGPDDGTTDDGTTDDGGDDGVDGDEVFTYGDDAFLDGLWDACASGDMIACDDLYMESPVDSDYERFADTCGDTTSGGTWCEPGRED